MMPTTPQHIQMAARRFKEAFASWSSVGTNKDGSIYGKGMGHEQIPNNWCVNTQSTD